MDMTDLFSVDILNSILDTSKVLSGKMQLEKGEFSMADVRSRQTWPTWRASQQGVDVVRDPYDFLVLRCAAILRAASASSRF